MSDSTQDTAKKPEFNKLQQILWPIHNYELKKFLPTSLLMFCILFVYTMVRDLKDVFIQKYAICGSTELIPTLKLWFVMPAAFLVVMLFTYLINKFGSNKTFYIMVSLFIAFYTVFVLFLFPNANSIHASAETVRKMQASWPGFFFYIIPCLTKTILSHSCQFCKRFLLLFYGAVTIYDHRKAEIQKQPQTPKRI